MTWSAISATTALTTRWVRLTLDARPMGREPSPPATRDPAAVRAQQIQADTLPWRAVERWLAQRAVRPFRQRPTFTPLKVLNVDHGPGGVAVALAQHTPRDSTVVAVDAVPGMAELARHRAWRRGARPNLHFVRAHATRLPFRAGAFDVVVSAGALSQWANPETVPALAELRRTLAAGGRYLLADLRRDVHPLLWVLVRVYQAWLAPRALRVLGEPGASVAAAYAPPEAEWLAALAKLPSLGVTAGPAWVMIEPTGNDARDST
jgi:ubiquinone/menaquinone biosynthesis C-methylase UbiE